MSKIDFSIFQDIVPMLQEDGPTPLCPINYDPYYKKCMDYFRTISSIKEYSKRALDLTTEILVENASHYSVWKYRLDTVNKINASLEEEWIFLNNLAHHNPKSYQIWHQRQALAERASNPKDEMEFVNSMIENDGKNYHAWSYRQWLVRTFGLWDQELLDLNRIIDDDIRNNSAWNQRFFIISRSPSPDVIKKEIQYTLGKIQLAPNNESPWNYYKGLLLYSEFDSSDIVEYKENRFALSVFLDYYKEKGMKEEYKSTCLTLERIDPVRQTYWRYKRDSI
ncbi:CAAX geranylgeranyltransferase alpha subunit [Boothiomyces sp. JEL0866]|nr:CAAX geranylgeranyltransferase alpha subunit [Boothiomyces sp. JEL0866]